MQTTILPRGRGVPPSNLLAATVVAILLTPTDVPFARALPAQEPTARRSVFSEIVDLGTVRVTVSGADGTPIGDLAAPDFELSVDGHPEDIVVFLNESDARMELAVAVDASGSIEQDVPRIRPLLQGFLAALDADDCVLMLPFSDEVGPGYWNVDVRSFVETFALGGETRLYDAVRAGLLALTDADARGISSAEFRRSGSPHCGDLVADRGDPKRAVVLITDGRDTSSLSTFGDLLVTAWEQDIPIIVLGVGIGAGTYPMRDDRYGRRLWQLSRDTARDLTELATISGGRFIAAARRGRHAQYFREILNTLRSSYRIGFRLEDVPFRGVTEWRSVEVRVKREDARLSAPEGIYVNTYSPQAAASLIESGLRHFDRGDLPAAAAAFDGATGAYWESDRGHYYRALTAFEAGDLEAARASASWALFLAPDDPAVQELDRDIAARITGATEIAASDTAPIGVWVAPASHGTIPRQQIARLTARMVAYHIRRTPGFRIIKRPPSIAPAGGFVVRIRDVENDGAIKAEVTLSDAGAAPAPRVWFTVSAREAAIDGADRPPVPEEMAEKVDELLSLLRRPKP